MRAAGFQELAGISFVDSHGEDLSHGPNRTASKTKKRRGADKSILDTKSLCYSV